MPLVRFEIPQSWTESRVSAFADAVHEALVETVDVPANDRFQVIAQHVPGRLILDPTYFGVPRSADAAVVQVTFRRGRTEAKKRAFYAAVARRAQAMGVRPEDVMIVLNENTPVDWSFGAGVAQMSPAEAAA